MPVETEGCRLDEKVEKYVEVVMSTVDEMIARIPREYRGAVMEEIDKVMRIKYCGSRRH